MKRIVAVLLICAWTTACSPAGGGPAQTQNVAPSTPAPSASASSAAVATSSQGTASPTPGTMPASISPTRLPVDESIEPVSLSNPSPDAAEALDICQVLDVHAVEKVSGMGRIDKARDAVHYAALTGREPEIKTDDPAWMITFRGELPMPKLQEVWIDPTCVVVDHDGGIYATGPVRMTSSGKTANPPADAHRPDRALPPLEP